VYRLIARGTIEQRMLELQEQKRSLTQLLLGKPGTTNESHLHFAEADLTALFAPLPSIDPTYQLRL
jgi:SNF2 family DNA or RNA helicase